MRVYLHIPTYHLGKIMPAREVPMDLPVPPFVGLRIGVYIGDGTSEAPGQTGTVEVTSVKINYSWRIAYEPTPIEDTATVIVHTNWAS